MLILHRALDEEKEKQMIICGLVTVTDLKKWMETILLMTMMTNMNNMDVFGFVFLAFFLAWLNSSFEVACFYGEAEGGTEVFVDISVEHAVIKCFFQLHRHCRNRFRNQNQHLS